MSKLNKKNKIENEMIIIDKDPDSDLAPWRCLSLYFNVIQSGTGAADAVAVVATIYTISIYYATQFTVSLTQSHTSSLIYLHISNLTINVFHAS